MALAVLAVFLAGLAAGCGGEKISSFTYVESSDPTSIDPALADESVGINIVRYMFDGLVAYDSASGKVKPAVAESWDVSPDATVFTFHLRKGVKFTNGREVKAGDFVYAWTRALDPETKSAMASSILEPVKGALAVADGEARTIEGVKAVDDYTLEVTLEFPLAEFVTFLGHPVSAPVPQEEVEKAGSGAGFSEAPIGNGPFRLKERAANEYVKLEKNPDYYGDAASVDEVTVKIIPNPATAVEELKAGNVDAVKQIPPGQTGALSGDSSVRVFEGQVNALGFLAMNLETEPWKNNDKLRQALNWAVDRETIAAKVLQGQSQPADGIVPAAMPGRQSEAMPYRFDQARAKALLAEAGYPDGNGLPPIKLVYRMEGSAADIAQAVQANLLAIGVKAEIEGLESEMFLDQMQGGQLGFFYIRWQADYISMDTFLYPLFQSEQPQNVFKYANPEVDALLDKARSSLDENDRFKAYNDAERMILADAPLVPVDFAQDVMVYSPRVKTFVHTSLGDIALSEIEMSDG
ncbi:MAG: peptide ABC transporter substrate-binding protein [Pseudomonadota bacterium]